MMLRRLRVPLLAQALVAACILTTQTASARRAVGGGSGLSSWSTNADDGLFGGAGRGARDAQRRDVLSRQEWAVDPLDSDVVRSHSSELGKECTDMVCKYLAGRDPLRIKLRTRPVKKGGGAEPGEALRAVAIVSSRSPKSGATIGAGFRLPLISPSVKRVKASWATTSPRMLNANESGGTGNAGGSKASPFLKWDYETACLTAHDRVEVEITLPRLRKSGKNPTVLYTFPISEGNLGDGSTYIPASGGTVKVFPNGRVKKEVDPFSKDAMKEVEEEGAIDVGKAYVHAAAGQGLVDPSWARGRAVWRQGRKVGVLQ
mmetsp:Transcript_21793/g.44914  ORF Transcript_21793/g.44914 Transcript_21793/m.44914 type:complete len:317 (-) Transcript_21793:1291-2241(-)